jgi:hypothetical protein
MAREEGRHARLVHKHANVEGLALHASNIVPVCRHRRDSVPGAEELNVFDCSVVGLTAVCSVGVTEKHSPRIPVVPRQA